MGAIAISEPISIKFGILIVRPNLVVCAKFLTIRTDITRLVHNKGKSDEDIYGSYI